MHCKPIRALGLLLGLCALIGPPNANAQSVGIQSDWALINDPGRFYARADALGADWVRIMVPQDSWRMHPDIYVNAVASAKASGRQVMVSLLSWNDYPTPDQWRAFAEDVEPQLAPYVDAWSVMNEPNWSSMAPAMSIICRDETGQVVVTRRGYRYVFRFRQARRGQWSRRHVHHRTRWVRRRLRHHRHYRRVRARIAVTGSANKTVAYRSCLSEGYGAAYRRVYDAAAPVLAADDGAKIVVGDLSPSDEVRNIMDAFFAPGRPAVYPDVFASHYSTLWQAGLYAAYAHAHGMRYWETEWGVRGGPTAQEWLEQYTTLRATVDKLFVYDTGADTGWDTRIPDGAFALLG